MSLSTFSGVSAIGSRRANPYSSPLVLYSDQAMLQNNPAPATPTHQCRPPPPRAEGVVNATDKNFCFLEGDDGKSSFIPPPAMKQVLHGDRVEAILHEDGEKMSAEPEQLLAAGLDRFIARVRRRNGRLGVSPDHPSIRHTLAARAKRNLDEAQLEDGDWVVAQLVRHPLKENDRSFFAQINEVIAKAADPGVPWHVTLARHSLEAASPVAGDGWQLAGENTPARQDLTAEPFFTIDSAKTRDIDDALCVKRREGGGWNLLVAVADPTAYFDEGHKADREARIRAFTVYLPGRNITMLPDELSHDLCSLRDGVDRRSLVCSLTINADGSLGDYHFALATVRSHAQLDYDSVSTWLESPGDAARQEWNPSETIAPQLRDLAELTEARARWRQQNTFTFRERPDYEFELDEAGNVLDIVIQERRIADRMIEEAMIAANTCGADFLARQVGHGIFNVHHAFDAEKVKGAQEFLQTQEIAVEPAMLTELPRYFELRRHLDERSDAWLEARLRQFQGYTTFSPLPGPHFGLGVDAYATWTSPIRKYSDIVNHRLIKMALQGKKATETADPQLMEQLAERRRLNRLAERDVKDWLYVRYLSTAAKENETFDAEVIAINRGGMRVRLVANGATVFVPASLIHEQRDQLVIDDKEGRIQVAGEERVKLGDSVSIALTAAREETRSLVGRLAS